MSLFRYYYTPAPAAAPPALTYDENVIALLGASLQGYWACDEATGNLVDGTGNGWTMTLATGTPTYQATGPTIASVAQYAVQTDGSARFATSSSFPQASTTNGLSLFGWIYLPSTSSALGDILNRYASSSDTVARLRHNSAGGPDIVFYQAGGAAVAEVNDTGKDLDGDAWHWLGAWWDPADDDVYLQMDDNSPVSAAGSTDIDSSVSAGWSLFGLSTGANLLRSGSRLAKVGVYDGVLTSDQRASLYTGSF